MLARTIAFASGAISLLIMAGCSTASNIPTVIEREGEKVSWVLGEDREIANASGKKCAQRVRTAGCKMSGNDMDRIDENVQSCKQVKSTTGKTTMEVFLLRDSGKIVTVTTKGADRFGSACPVTKFNLARNGGAEEIEEIVVVGHRLMFRSKRGAVYFMYSNNEMYELLNSKGDSYSSVTDIQGSQDGDTFTLVGSGFKNTYTDADLSSRFAQGKVRHIEFRRTTTERSLFRDE